MDAGTETYVDPALARLAELVAALGEQPISSYERSVLTRLCAWSSGEDITMLAGLIIRARG